jgi:hypothetical protein
MERVLSEPLVLVRREAAVLVGPLDQRAEGEPLTVFQQVADVNTQSRVGCLESRPNRVGEVFSYARQPERNWAAARSQSWATPIGMFRGTGHSAAI